MDDDYLAPLAHVLRHALETMENQAVFVTSFSEKPDLLSQWRGYCPGGAGVCIGFNKSEIESHCAQLGYRLEKCVYQHDILRGRIEEIVGDCFANLPQPNISRQQYDNLSSREQAEYAINYHSRLGHILDESAIDEILGEACKKIVMLAPLFKHEGFHEEAEWRIVATEPVGVTLHFRPGPSYLCPYVEVPILKNMTTLREVILGPNPNLQRAQTSVQMMLSFEGFDDVKVNASSLPFNNW
ncbi:DUF2971 domain-containing protein [Janthinobacterium lividum]|uniref:DUF2971 domain-containing protein n=1 Tax=Janthinobacterium lividum TaxID=29581 RepID=UPI00142E01E9|nr:DUF2971 domain-containing protein [Janthinobacterium lividum]MCC7714677.1 DUF2971 domain-containing protein [Janthinobacterium lividum]WQE30123.1 DUF2971 domain-containing protein [Janthinobacterium lividum]